MTIDSIAGSASFNCVSARFDAQILSDAAHAPALRFITCGSVDDGKSTLIGRLLLDSRAVLRDQLAHVSRSGAVDLAQFTDGLSAEREQGITIDVAWRYFATPARKFIIGDAPGHEQYTRNMVTAASQADCAVVLVDATKLDWRNPALTLLPQTRRHTLLAHLLRVPSLVFAVNKLDAVADPALAFAHIQAALDALASQAGLRAEATVPISALLGHNVVDAQPGWCGYRGPSLLTLLQALPVAQPEASGATALAVQWVEKTPDAAHTDIARRVLWGRVGAGSIHVGQTLRVMPSGQTAQVVRLLDAVRSPHDQRRAGQDVGVVLDRELDASRGDWLLALPAGPTQADDDWGDTPADATALTPGADDAAAPHAPRWAREVGATLAWLDDEPLVPGRVYWALHGHRWVKARVQHLRHRLDIHTLAPVADTTLTANAIGDVTLVLQAPIAALPYATNRQLGALVLVDAASNRTAAAALLH